MEVSVKMEYEIWYNDSDSMIEIEAKNEAEAIKEFNKLVPDEEIDEIN